MTRPSLAPEPFAGTNLQDFDSRTKYDELITKPRNGGLQAKHAWERDIVCFACLAPGHRASLCRVIRSPLLFVKLGREWSAATDVPAPTAEPTKRQAPTPMRAALVL